MKRFKRLSALLLSAVMLVGGSMTVFADDTIITEESADSTAQIELNIEIDSTFTVGIPVSADIDDKTGIGAYQVSVKGDLDPRYKLIVAPIDGYTSVDGDTTDSVNFLLKDQSNLLAPKADVVMNITGGQTEFICTDINLEEAVLVDYTMTVQEGQKLSAGIWTGVIKYNISLEVIGAEGVNAGDDAGEGIADGE